MYRPNRIGPHPIYDLDESSACTLPNNVNSFMQYNWIHASRPVVLSTKFFTSTRASVNFGQTASLTYSANNYLALCLPINLGSLFEKGNWPQDGVMMSVFGTMHVNSRSSFACLVTEGFWLQQTPQHTFVQYARCDPAVATTDIPLPGWKWWIPGGSERSISEKLVKVPGRAATDTDDGVDSTYTVQDVHAHCNINTTVIINPQTLAWLGTPWNLLLCTGFKNIGGIAANETLIEGTLGYNIYTHDLKVFDPNL